LGSIEKDITS